MDNAQNFRNQLIAETRRRLMEEGVPRIKKCLAELNEQEIWYRPNENSNSIGNLVLHLCGNVRQWLLSGLGGQPDIRKRQAEFDRRSPLPTSELFRQLDGTMREAEKLLDKLTTDQILHQYKVQGYQETGVSILVHVVEHFSYHVGQITYFVKWRKDMDMGFYRGVNLDVNSTTPSES